MPEKEPHPPKVSEMFQEILDIIQSSTQFDKIQEPADVDVLTQEMEKTMDQLNQRAEELYQATGMTREQLQEFSKHQENFSEEEWKLLSKVREQIDGFQKKAEQMIEDGLYHQIEAEEATDPSRKKPRPPSQKKGPSKRVKRKDWMSG